MQLYQGIIKIVIIISVSKSRISTVYELDLCMYVLSFRQGLITHYIGEIELEILMLVLRLLSAGTAQTHQCLALTLSCFLIIDGVLEFIFLVGIFKAFIRSHIQFLKVELQECASTRVS